MKTRKGIFFLAILLVPLLGGCARVNELSKTTKGAVLGGLAGATAGGIAGAQSGNPVAGAAIGGAVGAIGGGLTGRALDKRDQRLSEQQATLDQQRTEVEKNRALIEELKKSNLEARESGRGVTVNLPSVLFQFNSADLSSGGREKVQQIADILTRKAAGRSISVEGHASRERADQEDYNQRLSEKRARTVATELAGSGIESKRINSRGFGTRSPVAPNSTEEGRRKNRRVEVIIEN